MYDSIGQLLRVDDTDPTQKDMKQQKHVYKYDDCGNMIYEYMRGNGTGEATTENTYTYDALNRIIRAEESYGNAWREYQYDSLGNLTYENNSNSVHYDYKLNNLNQITEKTYGSNNKERTIYTYDKRGNLVLEEYGKNNGSGNGNGQRTTVGQYTYDETNKMVLGVNSSGESSAYLYNGLGALVEDTWKIAKNGYGYHSVDAGLDDTDTGSGRGGGGSNGNGNGNGNGQGNGNGSGDKPTGSLVTSFSTVVKQFVVDYTSPTFEPLMEHEVNGLDYRYVYGNDRLSVNITGVETSSGNLIENGNQIRLYYHMDYLGTTDYLTSPVSLKVTSWTHYNEWGEITHNAVLKSGQRELDLVKRYATHDYDAVLGMYYAKARFYDAENRRFASMDPVKGEITDPLTMVQYIYAIDCPLVYIDLGGERADPPSTDGGNKNNTSAKPAVPKPSTPKASDATKGATSGLKGPTNSNNGVTSGVNGAVSGAGMSPTSDRGTKYIVNASAGLKLRSIANLFGRVIMVLPYGTSVISLGQSTSANGYSWLKVLANGQEGWVASKYLQATIIKTPSIPSIYPSGSGAGTSSGPVSLPQTAPGPSNPFPPIRFSYVLDWKPALPNGNNGAAQGSASGGYMEPFGCGSQIAFPQIFDHTSYIIRDVTDDSHSTYYFAGAIRVQQGTTTRVVIPDGKELEAVLSTYFNYNVPGAGIFPDGGGIQLGVGPVAAVLNLEPDNTTLTGTFTHNNQTHQFGVRLDFTKFEAGITYSSTIQGPNNDSNNGYSEAETYTHYNINGGFVVLMVGVASGYISLNEFYQYAVRGG